MCPVNGEHAGRWGRERAPAWESSEEAKGGVAGDKKDHRQSAAHTPVTPRTLPTRASTSKSCRLALATAGFGGVGVPRGGAGGSGSTTSTSASLQARTDKRGEGAEPSRGTILASGEQASGQAHSATGRTGAAIAVYIFQACMSNRRTLTRSVRCSAGVVVASHCANPLHPNARKPELQIAACSVTLV